MSRRIAFGLIVLLALALFARPIVLGEVLTFRDHSDYFQPLRYFTAVELRNFRLPLWNPYNASGEPWLANPQTAVFYPPFWIFLFVPFAQAYMLFLLAHMVLLGWGAYLLFSRFASARAALIGAITLMLCGPTLSMLDIQNSFTTFAWIPLVLWCGMAEASSVVSGVAIAMSFLAGEPLFAAVGALMYALVRRKELIDTALTAFCLAAVTLLPFLAMIAGSDRAGAVPAAEVLRDSMSPSDWLRMIVPGATAQQHFIPIVYIGIVPALLAIAGIATSLRTPSARPWLLLLVSSAVVASGRYLPWVGDLLVKSPVTILRYPARVVPLGALALIALAVIGFDRLGRATRLAGAPLAVALIIIDLVPCVAPLLRSGAFDTHAVPYSLNIGRDGKIARLMQPERAFDRHVWISGYLNLLERRFDAFTAAPVISQAYLQLYQTGLQRREVLDSMSIAYLLTATPRGVVAQHNPAAFPLAYFRDPRGQILRPSALAFTTRALFVVVDAPSDGIVVATQQDAAGWDVEIDRRTAAREREGVFRAVRVTRGHHEIVWRYHPRSFMIGAALSILAIARMLLSRNFVKGKWHKKNFSRQ